MRYFRVLADNSRYPDRWFLDEPLTAAGEELDAREFCYGKLYSGPPPAVLPIGKEGRRVDFHLAAFDMPVISTVIGDVLSNLGAADIQRFPVTVGDGIKGYEILNAVCQEDCVDESRARVRKWELEDDRPDKLGKYREIAPLLIDALRTNGRHIFRIRGFVVPLIVSEEVKSAIEELPDLGVVFKPVSGDRVV